MRTIPLSQGKEAVVDDEDWQWLSSYRWFVMKSGRVWYAERNKPSPNRGLIQMHRQIMAAPPGLLVDHRDGDGLNNQRSNLRFTTKCGNRANSRPQAGSTSSLKGVHWSSTRRRWVAKLRADGVNYYLGQFEDEEEAARAYDVAALRYFGEFARPNFPEERCG